MGDDDDHGPQLAFTPQTTCRLPPPRTAPPSLHAVQNAQGFLATASSNSLPPPSFSPSDARMNLPAHKRSRRATTTEQPRADVVDASSSSSVSVPMRRRHPFSPLTFFATTLALAVDSSLLGHVRAAPASPTQVDVEDGKGKRRALDVVDNAWHRRPQDSTASERRKHDEAVLAAESNFWSSPSAPVPTVLPRLVNEHIPTPSSSYTPAYPFISRPTKSPSLDASIDLAEMPHQVISRFSGVSTAALHATSIPAGWQPNDRTKFYDSRSIIITSVVLSSFIVATIIASVLVRRKKAIKKKSARDKDKLGDGGRDGEDADGDGLETGTGKARGKSKGRNRWRDGLDRLRRSSRRRADHDRSDSGSDTEDEKDRRRSGAKKSSGRMVRSVGALRRRVRRKARRSTVVVEEVIEQDGRTVQGEATAARRRRVSRVSRENDGSGRLGSLDDEIDSPSLRRSTSTRTTVTRPSFDRQSNRSPRPTVTGGLSLPTANNPLDTGSVYSFHSGRSRRGVDVGEFLLDPASRDSMVDLRLAGVPVSSTAAAAGVDRGGRSGASGLSGMSSLASFTTHAPAAIAVAPNVIPQFPPAYRPTAVVLQSTTRLDAAALERGSQGRRTARAVDGAEHGYVSFSRPGSVFGQVDSDGDAEAIVRRRREAEAMGFGRVSSREERGDFRDALLESGAPAEGDVKRRSAEMTVAAGAGISSNGISGTRRTHSLDAPGLDHAFLAGDPSVLDDLSLPSSPPPDPYATSSSTDVPAASSATTAHIATDEKAVLRQISTGGSVPPVQRPFTRGAAQERWASGQGHCGVEEEGDAASGHDGSGAPSAPPLFVDEDGFERAVEDDISFGHCNSGIANSSSRVVFPSSSSPPAGARCVDKGKGVLPAPPEPLAPTFSPFDQPYRPGSSPTSPLFSSASPSSSGATRHGAAHSRSTDSIPSAPPMPGEDDDSSATTTSTGSYSSSFPPPSSSFDAATAKTAGSRYSTSTSSRPSSSSPPPPWCKEEGVVTSCSGEGAAARQAARSEKDREYEAERLASLRLIASSPHELDAAPPSHACMAVPLLPAYASAPPADEVEVDVEAPEYEGHVVSGPGRV